MHACISFRSLAIESRFIRSGTVEGFGAALRLGMGLMCGLGMGFEGNIVEVDIGGNVVSRGLETAAPMVSPSNLHAF